jgi:predicted PurR-regulated permease PerM
MNVSQECARSNSAYRHTGLARSCALSREFKLRTIFMLCAGTVAIAAVVVAWQARVVFLVLFAGCLGALILDTLTSLIQSWSRLPRMPAFALLLAIIGLALGLGIWLRGPALAQQFNQLQVDIPNAVRQVYSTLDQSSWGHWILTNVADATQWPRWLPFAASGLGGAMAAIASTVASMLLITLASVYLAAEPHFYLNGIRRVLPAASLSVVESCLAGAIRTLRYWLLSRLVSMIAVGLLIALGLWLLSVPLAGTLAIIAAILTFVPNIGPFASALPASLLAFAISPTKGVFAVAIFCLAHFIEGNLVTPLADRQIVKLPPFLTLSVQLLLAPMTGVLGVAMAAPLLAATLGIVRALQQLRSQPDDQSPLRQTIRMPDS